MAEPFEDPSPFEQYLGRYVLEVLKAGYFIEVAPRLHPEDTIVLSVYSTYRERLNRMAVRKEIELTRNPISRANYDAEDVIQKLRKRQG